jgi:hypothetical protein
MGDWTPQKAGSDLLKRQMSYIKPLNGSIGPKQTKCEIADENEHVDYDQYVCNITTTRTPDVPSGHAFSVKTRTCLMWNGANSTKVVVTTKVEFTARSFIKGQSLFLYKPNMIPAELTSQHRYHRKVCDRRTKAVSQRAGAINARVHEGTR